MGGSILIVEDELVTQRLTAASLEPAGYKVTRARSLGVVPRLHGAGAILRVYDPAATRKLDGCIRPMTASPTWIRPSRRSGTPTRWSSSPTGRSSGLCTSAGSGRSCEPRSSLTGEISSSRRSAGGRVRALQPRPRGGDLPHSRNGCRCRSSVTVTPGQNSQVPV